MILIHFYSLYFSYDFFLCFRQALGISSKHGYNPILEYHCWIYYFLLCLDSYKHLISKKYCFKNVWGKRLSYLMFLTIKFEVQNEYDWAQVQALFERLVAERCSLVSWEIQTCLLGISAEAVSVGHPSSAGPGARWPGRPVWPMTVGRLRAFVTVFHTLPSTAPLKVKKNTVDKTSWIDRWISTLAMLNAQSWGVWYHKQTFLSLTISSTSYKHT